ncbi:MAG: lysoplasmalogenase [Deltaproteobacteria bacterium]|nr:lysoplasmalogenase [Candidatus Zymogenaceae bacterium]
MPVYLPIIVVLAVLVPLLVYFEIKKQKKWIYVLKPICTVLIITAALLSLTLPGHVRIYTLSIVLGLLLSLVGDISLMFQEHKKPFMVGLVFFLLAHVVYGIVFLKFAGITSSCYVFGAIFLALGVAIYIFFYPGLGTMKGPVAAYILIITFMVTSAGSTLSASSFPRPAAILVTIGGILFWFSDVILATNRFRIPMKYNRLSLIPYFTGQLLIALSTHLFGS